MINQLRKKLKEKEVIIATRIDFTWPQLIEIIGSNELYDYVEFLAEYAPFDHYDLENMARAAELHNISMIIKPDYHNRIYVAQKAMASGFEGILFTDHTTAAEVRETIRQITPATPDGGALGFVNRRWIRNANLSSQMDYARDVCDIVKGFMIEKVEAVHYRSAVSITYFSTSLTSSGCALLSNPEFMEKSAGPNCRKSTSST